MKKKMFLAIYIAIIAMNNIFCMENNNENLLQLITTKTNNGYTKLESILKQKIVDNYSTITPQLQYDMLKACIDSNNLTCLSLCLNNHFNPNRYHKELSLLHQAIEQNKPCLLFLLTTANPDLIPLNNKQQTPLALAIHLKYESCIKTMRIAIAKKYNAIAKNQSHCGLTKHILNPGMCELCIIELEQELKRYGFWQLCKNVNDVVEVMLY